MVNRSTLYTAERIRKEGVRFKQELKIDIKIGRNLEISIKKHERIIGNIKKQYLKNTEDLK